MKVLLEQRPEDESRRKNTPSRGSREEEATGGGEVGQFKGRQRSGPSTEGRGSRVGRSIRKQAGAESSSLAEARPRWPWSQQGRLGQGAGCRERGGNGLEAASGGRATWSMRALHAHRDGLPPAPASLTFLLTRKLAATASPWVKLSMVLASRLR